jgi:hypothetical protein
MDTIDTSFVRNVALAALLFGECQLARAKPQVDQAAQALGVAGRLAARNRSPRLTRRLRRNWCNLEPWRDSEPVRTVRAELAAFHAVGQAARRSSRVSRR